MTAAVIVIDALKAGEQFLRQPVGLAVAVLVFEHENFRRLADIDLPSGADRIFCHCDSERGLDVRPLSEHRDLIRPALPL